MAHLQQNTKLNRLRTAINKAYRLDETRCLEQLLPQVKYAESMQQKIAQRADQLVVTARAEQKKLGWANQFLHQYDISSEEGVALMSMAEALLRVPDHLTMDKLIADKISSVHWTDPEKTNDGLMTHAATWSLLLTGKIFSPTLENQKSLLHSLKSAVSRIGIEMIRPVILQGMKIMGKQFVMGETIESAIAHAEPLEQQGYRYSYDMLGESARTHEDAERYFHAYLQAIQAVGKTCHYDNPIQNPGISIKLSALHPRYEYTQHQRVLTELVQRVLLLAQEARRYQIGLTIDAEECDRLDLSLDIFQRAFEDPVMNHWEGLGLAVQAYQKRATYVIDWLIALSQANNNKPIMVRLVKGAYWDYEIKQTQVLGLNDYPVFTRKYATDVSYLACAKKMLEHRSNLYPQFGTHNAYCVAAIMEFAGTAGGFEFQCLHGMGRPLYDQVIASKHTPHYPCRIYAPVGTHKNLLGYLVRRLLENGANTSFINQLAHEDLPIAEINVDPVRYIESLEHKPHPKIPLPKYIYNEWLNAKSIDLSDPDQLAALKKAIDKAEQKTWFACSLIDGKCCNDEEEIPITSPHDRTFVVGQACPAQPEQVDKAFASAALAQVEWGQRDVDDRARILEQAAELFEQRMTDFITLLVREGGRCLPDAISEVREAVDFCRYYAMRARKDFLPQPLPGPTGETNQLILRPRGVIASISPWNFPLAIFIGQVVAALVTGNAVVAKPAEQTPLTAYEAVRVLHQAGLPKAVLQRLIGAGETIGARMIVNPHLAGVIFTGSTEVAQLINRTLANRTGPIIPLIAETGGQNAMIVDSSALPEQTVIDVVQSAFNSAGQRCSALRILFLQEDIADNFLTMLKGHMAQLSIGDPGLISTDIGPVIDQGAFTQLQKHFALMGKQAKLLYQAPLPPHFAPDFFAPCVFEIEHMSLLKREVFGPILHVIRYRSEHLANVIGQITASGYGLTCGIQSRITANINAIAAHLPVGNVYVNRNMIGAVVGVQPFGGERLSGTGPKAGGPHYLPRLCVEHAISINTTAAGGNASLVSMQEE